MQIQKLVISGGNFKPDTLKPKEVVSLLLDDEEIEQKCKNPLRPFFANANNISLFSDRQRAEERKHMEDMRELDRKRKYMATIKVSIWYLLCISFLVLLHAI